MMEARTDEQIVRAYMSLNRGDVSRPSYHDALASLDRMVARIAELEARSPKGPWTAEGAHCPTCDCVGKTW